MSTLAAVVRLSEEAGAEHGEISPFIFGGVALGILVLLLIITTMINVDR